MTTAISKRHRLKIIQVTVGQWNNDCGNMQFSIVGLGVYQYRKGDINAWVPLSMEVMIKI